MSEPELRFKADDGTEFSEWVEFKFLDLLESIVDFRGRTPKKLGMDWADHKTNHLALSAVNVKMGYVDIDNDPHYGDDALYDKWMHGRELHKGQVLFTTEAPMGNVAQVPNNEPYILSQRTIALNPKRDLIYENFLTALLGSPTVQNKLEILATGGTARGVSQKSLSHLSVKIPCLIEQQKIADLFSTLDNVIDSVQKEVDSWEQMKRGVMQKLFSQEVRFKADDGTDFPEWENKQIEDIGYCIAGATPSTRNDEYWLGGTIPWMSSGEVNNGIIFDTEKKITQLGYDKTSTKLVPPGTVVIALAGQGKTRGKVAITRIELCTNQSLASIVAKTDYNADYLYQYLLTCYDDLRNISSGDGTRGGLNLKLIEEYKIMLPCLEEQQKIADCLSEFDLVIEKTKQKLEAYKQLKKGLMQRMFV